MPDSLDYVHCTLFSLQEARLGAELGETKAKRKGDPAGCSRAVAALTCLHYCWARLITT
jgi:hypothetical protein